MPTLFHIYSSPICDRSVSRDLGTVSSSREARRSSSKWGRTPKKGNSS